MPRLRHLMLAAVALATASGCWAQSLQEVYEAARAYDAAYLAARAQADSAQYRAAQANALRLPSVSGGGSLTRAETNPPPSLTNPSGDRFGATTTALSVTGRQPLFTIKIPASTPSLRPRPIVTFASSVSFTTVPAGAVVSQT